MKDFLRPSGRLSSLPFHARLVYSVFLGFTLGALALTAWLGADMVGADLRGVPEYYGGGVESHPGTKAATAVVSAGPAIELPAEAMAPATRDPMPVRKLLEVTHFHLFSMPVYLMILAHLFMLSSLGSRAKTLWISLGSLAVASHVAAPWIARNGDAASTLIYGTSGGLLLLSFVVMSAVPLFEMWRPRS